MKNYFLTLVLAVLVVLTGVSLKQSVASIGGSPVPPTPKYTAIGGSPVPPTPKLMAIGGSPVPPTPKLMGIGGSPVPPTPKIGTTSETVR